MPEIIIKERVPGHSYWSPDYNQCATLVRVIPKTGEYLIRVTVDGVTQEVLVTRIGDECR